MLFYKNRVKLKKLISFLLSYSLVFNNILYASSAIIVSNNNHETKVYTIEEDEEDEAIVIDIASATTDTTIYRYDREIKVSLNSFESFNTESKKVIINNSKEKARSKLLNNKEIETNKNYDDNNNNIADIIVFFLEDKTNSDSTNTDINSVLSSTTFELLGSAEQFLFLSLNGNITAKGLNYINIPKLTLAAGVRCDIDQELIEIISNNKISLLPTEDKNHLALDASEINELNILAREIDISGGIIVKGSLAITTGLSNRKQEDNNNKPKYSFQTSIFGNIQAAYLKLTNLEDNTDINIATFMITTLGNLDLYSKGNILLNTNTAKLISKESDININANDLTLDDKAVILSRNDINLNLNNRLFANNKSLIQTKEGTITILNPKNISLSNDSRIESTNELTITSDNLNLNDSAILLSHNNMLLTITNSLLSTNKSIINTKKGNIVIPQLKELKNEESSIIQSSNEIKITANNLIQNNSATILAKGNMLLNITDSLTQSGEGKIQSNNKLTINANNLTLNNSSTLSSIGNMKLILNKTLINSNKSLIYADEESITIQTKDINISDSRIQSNKELEITTNNLNLNDSAIILSKNSILLAVAGNISGINKSTIQTKEGNISIPSSKGINLIGESEIQSANKLEITSADLKLDNLSILLSQNDDVTMTISNSFHITNKSLINTGKGNITLKTKQYTQLDSIIDSANKLTISTTDHDIILDNSSILSSIEDMKLTSDKNLVNKNESIIHTKEGSIALETKLLTLQDSEIESANGLTITANHLNLDNSAILSSVKDMTITLNNNLVNNNKSIISTETGDITIKLQELKNIGTSIIQSGDKLNINGKLIENIGVNMGNSHSVIFVGSGLSPGESQTVRHGYEKVDVSLTTDPSQILAKGNMSLIVDNIQNRGSNIISESKLTINGIALNNERLSFIHNVKYTTHSHWRGEYRMRVKWFETWYILKIGRHRTYEHAYRDYWNSELFYSNTPSLIIGNSIEINLVDILAQDSAKIHKDRNFIESASRIEAANELIINSNRMLNKGIIVSSTNKEFVTVNSELNNIGGAIISKTGGKIKADTLNNIALVRQFSPGGVIFSEMVQPSIIGTSANPEQLAIDCKKNDGTDSSELADDNRMIIEAQKVENIGSYLIGGSGTVEVIANKFKSTTQEIRNRIEGANNILDTTQNFKSGIFGRKVEIIAKESIFVAGTDLKATEFIKLKTKQLEITDVKDKHYEEHTKEDEGLFSKSTEHSLTSSTKSVQTEITAPNVEIEAEGDVNMIAPVIVGKDVYIESKNGDVNIEDTKDKSLKQSYNYQEKTDFLGIAISGATAVVTSAVMTILGVVTGGAGVVAVATSGVIGTVVEAFKNKKTSTETTTTEYDETLVKTKIHAENLKIKSKDTLYIPSQDSLVVGADKSLMADKAIKEYEEKEVHKTEKHSKKIETDFWGSIMTGAISGIITTSIVKSVDNILNLLGLSDSEEEDKKDCKKQLSDQSGNSKKQLSDQSKREITDEKIEKDDEGETNEINMLGSLSEEFESTGRGPGVINGKLNPTTNKYEVNYEKDEGSLSYGIWQIETATKDKTMDKYLRFLEENGYDNIYSRLQEAGGFEGAKNGDIKFVNTWQQIAKENSELFRKSQYEFIKKNNYEERALYYLNVNNPNFNLDIRHPIIKDVLWSTGVQHSVSGVKTIMRETFEDKKDLTDEEFIRKIYEERTRYVERDRGSKPPIESDPDGTLHKRYINEMNEALKRLKQ